MSSQRHKARSVSDAYLDAARDCILDVGWRRTTLTEVARRAGVSRMTIYRRWADMPQLLGDLLTREWEELLAVTAPYDADGAPGPQRIADVLVAAATALRANPLFARIVEVDPELLLPYLLERRGRSQEIVLGLLTDAIEAGQAAGTVRTGDPTTLARAVLLAAHGFVLSIRTMADDRVDEAALDNELVTLVVRHLTPMEGIR